MRNASVVMNSIRIIGLFVAAGIAEISGVYLIWQWVRDDKPVFWGLFGLVALFVYSWIQTLQTFDFGRAFAAYGGVFVSLALLWGWGVDEHTPDRWDWIGVSIILIGVATIVYAPRA